MIARPLYRPILATLVIVGAILGKQAWAGHRSTAVLGALAKGPSEHRVSVIVTLPFVPETFHLTELQEIGRVQKVDGRTIYLADAKLPGLRVLASHYWVESIVPWARGVP